MNTTLTTPEANKELNRQTDLMAKDPDIIKIVEHIESKLATTKNHYGDYMAFLTPYQKEGMAKFVGLILIKAGANASGVSDALNILGGNY